MGYFRSDIFTDKTKFFNWFCIDLHVFRDPDFVSDLLKFKSIN